MGIRFHCPNGHKLHVKSYMGGLHAKCPQCGAKVVVPSQSTRKGKSDAARGTYDLAEAAREAETAAEVGNWYVRPYTGGQFGPAPAETFQAWLREGRVGADALLWREGWPEWRVAGDVFPSLVSSGAALRTPAIPADLPPPSAGPAAGNAPLEDLLVPDAVAPLALPGMSDHFQLKVLGILAGIVVVLLIGVWIVMHR